ncbi:hypothetical protein [Achromobacter spanius]|uniref:hypothetical protein n=1 Tax=Achromobacter spanius TaxID=217203 RepID=UPI00380D5F68
MSGFLRQLASRSVGTAPRLRSAPSPRAMEVLGVGPRDAWPGDTRDAVAASEAFARTGSDDAGSNDARSVPTPSHAPWSAGLGHAERHAEKAGANGRDAADVASVRVVHASVTPPLSEADRPTRSAEPAEQDALSPERHLRALRPIDPDDDASEGRRTRPAAVSPITRPLPAAARGAQDVTALAHPATPPVSTFAADARALPARNARSDPDDATANRLAQPPSPPDVHITIDRLEVAPPPQRAAPTAPRSSALSLRAYLTARRTGLP